MQVEKKERVRVPENRCTGCSLDFRMVGMAKVENGKCENCVAKDKAKMQLIGMNMVLALPEGRGE